MIRLILATALIHGDFLSKDEGEDAISLPLNRINKGKQLLTIQAGPVRKSKLEIAVFVEILVEFNVDV